MVYGKTCMIFCGMESEREVGQRKRESQRIESLKLYIIFASFSFRFKRGYDVTQLQKHCHRNNSDCANWRSHLLHGNNNPKKPKYFALHDCHCIHLVDLIKFVWFHIDLLYSNCGACVSARVLIAHCLKYFILIDILDELPPSSPPDAFILFTCSD